mmetsp:Transcript_31417/g.66461  ORF Transcript_31417/g.66461 Transcript_31417/m.66461 type:complete len:236 (-) Transcript_31417:2908-3615(-)
MLRGRIWSELRAVMITIMMITTTRMITTIIPTPTTPIPTPPIPTPPIPTPPPKYSPSNSSDDTTTPPTHSASSTPSNTASPTTSSTGTTPSSPPATKPSSTSTTTGPSPPSPSVPSSIRPWNSGNDIPTFKSEDGPVTSPSPLPPPLVVSKRHCIDRENRSPSRWPSTAAFPIPHRHPLLPLLENSSPFVGTRTANEPSIILASFPISTPASCSRRDRSSTRITCVSSGTRRWKN